MMMRIFCLLGLVGIWFVPGASSFVDSWWGFFPAAAMFFSFAIALMGWGAWLERFVGGGAASVYLLSSLVAVAFAMVFGHLSLLGESHRWIFILFLFVGLFLFKRGQWKEWFFSFHNRWFLGIIVFIFALRFFSAYLPQAHGDPLLYHLMAPRLWNAQGVVALNKDLPVPLLASTWEYFFLWPQVLLTGAKASVSDLILAQAFSQWIHLVWGLYGCLFVVKSLWERSMEAMGEWEELLLLLAFLFVTSMQWTGALAKNDCGIAFWCLGAWLYLGRKDSSHWLLSGIFAGLAVAGKISAILFIIPLGVMELAKLLYALARKKERVQKSLGLLLAAIVGVVLGAGPVYLRNWIETQNPFYTMFAHIFPSPWISQSWADHFSTHQPSGERHYGKTFLYRVHQLLRESPAYYLWLLFPVLLFFSNARKKLYQLRDWLTLFLLSFFLCVFAVLQNAEVRYLGASLWVGAILGVYFYILFFSLWAKELKKGRIYAGLLFVLMAVLLATSHLPTHFLWKFYKTAPGESMVLKHTAGQAKAWVREHVPHDRLVVLYGDNETYYMSTSRVAVLSERPDIDEATYGKTDLREFLDGLCRTSEAKYLLDARDSASLAGRFPSNAWEQAILFEADGARIYDLVKLQELILHQNVGCGRS